MGAIRSLAKEGWGAFLLCCALAAPALADGEARTETVRFADPRWPSVKVVRGAAPMPAAVSKPMFRATAANSEIVTFGDGNGSRVTVVRGPGSALASVPGLALGHIPAGRVETVSFGGAGGPLVNIVRGGITRAGSSPPPAPDSGIGLFGAASGGELDRVAFAVDGAESGHGSNPAMWRPELGGPQGPMQVSAAAALDVGGGDRFDIRQNRLLGRAYLAKLYQRYGSWPDAIAAYNWGPGNLDQWIAAGRPTEALPLETARYLLKVLRDSLLGSS